MERFETHLSPLATAPREARAFVHATLETAGHAELVDVAGLLVTELVSNVVCHVGAPMTLCAVVDPQGVRVEVEDPSPQPPEVQHPDMSDDHGRGLLLIATLANQWGVTHHDDGKTVWFEL